MTIVFVVYISCDRYLFHIHLIFFGGPGQIQHAHVYVICLCLFLLWNKRSSLTVTQHPRMKKGNLQPGPRMLRVRTAITLLLLEKTHTSCHGNKELDIANNCPTHPTSPVNMKWYRFVSQKLTSVRITCSFMQSTLHFMQLLQIKLYFIAN